MATRRVLDIGQCNYDHSRISALIRAEFGAEVVRVHSATEAMERLRNETFDLVLVNRVLDQTAEEGIDLIREAKANAKTSAAPVMLVSNFPEAQVEAVAAGAIPGFGKASLAEVATRERLEKYLGGVGVS